MEWNRTKTIFIIVFLILDIFLAFQYFDKRSNNQFPILEKSTLQEDMKADHISYGNLSKETSKAPQSLHKSESLSKARLNR